MSSIVQAHRQLLGAIAFAARAHQGQLRKDGRTPYASHPFRVLLIVRHVFGFEDPLMLTAAVLHDTIEDTRTDFDDLAEEFGDEVAGWVALLSKDKRLKDDPREDAYRAGLASAPWQVKVCKLGDVFDNLLDSGHLSAAQRARTVGRARLYLDALDDPAYPEAARKAYDTVSALWEEIRSSAT